MKTRALRIFAFAALLSLNNVVNAGTPVLYALNALDEIIDENTIIELVGVNPDTGFVSSIGELPKRARGSLAVSPDGRVFTVSVDLETFSQPGTLYEIDVVNTPGIPGIPLIATPVGDTGINWNTGLDFNSSGELFGTRDNFDGTADWVVYDIDTGVGTVLGPVGAFPPAGDVAFIPEFSGPGTVDTPFLSSFDFRGPFFGRPPELISNGGFDDGAGQSTLVCPPTDWDCVGEAGATSGATGGPLDSRDGYLAMTTPTGGGATFVFQDVAVTPGEDYLLSFDYSADGSGDTGFTAQCDGGVVFSETNGAFNPGWDSMDDIARFERTCQATSDTLRITFTGGSGPTGFVGVDNISIREVLTGKLVQLEPIAGAGTEVGDFVVFDQAFSLEYFDGRLVATNNDSGSDIYEIDPVTAAPTFLSSPALTVNLVEFAAYEPIETFFEFELNAFSATGAGANFADDFNDGVPSPSCVNSSRFCVATRVREVGGALIFSNDDGASPGLPPVLPGFRFDAFGGIPIIDETSGTLSARSTWRGAFEDIGNEPFGSGVSTALTAWSNDFVDFNVVQLDFAKAEDGSIKVFFTTYVVGVGNLADYHATAAGSDTVTSASGDIVLELVLDQASDTVTPRYSTDGGVTFIEYADWENNAGGALPFVFNVAAPEFNTASAFGGSVPGEPAEEPADPDAEQVPVPLAALLALACALLLGAGVIRAGIKA